MTLQPLDGAALALCLSLDDLAPYGFTPASLTPEQALFLLRQACRGQGLPPAPVSELELYPDSRGVLIFAHQSPGRSLRPLPVRPLRRCRVRRHST